MKRVVAIHSGTAVAAHAVRSRTRAVLAHHDRHLRRKAIRLANDEKALIDLAEPVVLADGDLLELEDGSLVQIVAAPEDLLQVQGRDAIHLTQLAWHIGNRHLPAEVRDGSILILRDHVIRAMLEGLGATVTDIVAPFTPTRGAYDASGHGHSHDHGDGHHHDHDMDHGHLHSHGHHHHR